jgi:hypothetical protein
VVVRRGVARQQGEGATRTDSLSAGRHPAARIADVEGPRAGGTLGPQDAVRPRVVGLSHAGDRPMTTPDPERTPAEPTDVEPADASDTEGHAFLTEDLARTHQQDKARQIDRTTRDARARGSEGRRGFFDRIRGR